MVSFVTLSVKSNSYNSPISNCSYNFGGAEPYKEIVYREAYKNNVDPILIAAIINHESGGDPLATGRAQDLGLMQIRVVHYPQCPQCLYDPDTNIKLGTKIFKDYRQIKGNIYTTISAYNTGPNPLGGWINVKYIRNVTEEYNKILLSRKCII